MSDGAPGSVRMTLANTLQSLPGETGPDVAEWLAGQPHAVSECSGTLGPLLSAAPYLFDLVRRHSDWLANTLADEADAVCEEILSVARSAAAMPSGEAGTLLRTLKGRLALLAALAETGGVWPTQRAVAALSEFADASLDAALGSLVREAAAKGIFADPNVKSADCGLAIFALGKQGGRELNYSSDVDIVAFYDADTGALADPLEATRHYGRLVRDLARLMEDRTEQGYVFRIDLRLRPDPGSTPVAISFDSAMTYYEARGQNWERAAWIKARPCAGDKRVGEAFLLQLAPFIWRKHLDFATISDIQAMKRQINIVRKVGEARLPAHNVKLGRGGIREIEFFAQTQQLIAGGRETALRVRPTVSALAALAQCGWITEETSKALTGAYWFLRAVENRVQMQRDEQTHTLPESEEGLMQIATLMGLELREFEKRYTSALDTVVTYYSELFTEGETLASEIGDLVFTGSDDDPGTVETLSGLGFENPSVASAIIRKWHYGSYAATRASAARAHLTELLPGLLTVISASRNADLALQRFDHFLSRFPSGIQLFALLRTHPNLTRLLVAFMASAPRLAEAVIHRAHVMDGLIDPAFAEDVTDSEVLTSRVREFLDEARSYEDRIDRARIIGQEQKFLISAAFVSGTIDASRAGRQFTTLAETLLDRLLAAARLEFSQRHGVIPGAEMGLLGFGKMASCEMTASSDLDFIMLYRAPSEVEESDGDKPLAPSQYFARLTQRLVAALSAPTAEGVLYEADMRLRPSGNAGPLATSISGFRDYQQNHAWTWERLALSRARFIAGDEAFHSVIDDAVEEALSAPRDATKIIADVQDMRARIARDRKPRHPFDLKLLPGGLIDIEFVAQSAQLVARQKLDLPRAAPPEVLLRMSETGLLPAAAELAEIHTLYTTLLQAMSICLINPFSEESWTGAFRELLLELTHFPDFDRLQLALEQGQQRVQEIAASWYGMADRL